jgi:hypothetical protein
VDVSVFGTRSPSGIWFAFALSGVVAATVAATWFELGKWRGSDLVGKSSTAEPDTDDQAGPGDYAEDATGVETDGGARNDE